MKKTNMHDIKINRKFNPEKRYVLENKKTGKIASSSNSLTTEATVAVTENDVYGLKTVLPLDQARRLLQHNRIVEKGQRSKKNSSVRKNTREQAKIMLPYLAVSYYNTLPTHRSHRINEFCKWIVQELQNRQSDVQKEATRKGFHDLIEADRTKRWWQDQLKKLQS